MNSLIYVAAAIFLSVLYLSSKKPQAYPYPPGPPADPVIGHIRKLPRVKLEEKLHEWAQTYGDVMRIWVPGRSIIVCNSEKAANDLLDKRGVKHSSRPSLTVLTLMGWGEVTALLPYGKRMNRQRRMLNHYLFKKRTEDYYPAQVKQARFAVQRLLASPQDWERAFALMNATIFFKVAYGHELHSTDDEYFKMAEAGMDAVNSYGPIGNTIVDILPFLQHLPSWFPGTHWANYGRKVNHVVRRLHDFPYDDVQRQMKEGTAETSFIETQIRMLEENDKEVDPDVPRDIKAGAAIMFFAGLDTTSASMGVMLLTMVLNPDAVRRAQKEIDAVVGNDRLPDFGDREKLPYIEAFVEEAARWHPSLPGGIPHLTTEDDVYEGMFIPKGSLVMANARGITMDERVYREPSRFYPERFLPKPEGYGEPFSTAGFGYGRRICPGRYLAQNSIWILCASILATLDITKAIGDDGREITPKTEFSADGVQMPKHFAFEVKPRSEKTYQLVTDEIAFPMHAPTHTH